MGKFAVVAVVVVGDKGYSTHVDDANGVLGVVVGGIVVGTVGNIGVDNVVEVGIVEEVFENHPQIG